MRRIMVVMFVVLAFAGLVSTCALAGDADKCASGEKASPIESAAVAIPNATQGVFDAAAPIIPGATDVVAKAATPVTEGTAEAAKAVVSPLTESEY